MMKKTDILLIIVTEQLLTKLTEEEVKTKEEIRNKVDQPKVSYS